MTSNTGSLTLRIKAVSLSDEAKYIRRIERRLARARARAKSGEAVARIDAQRATISHHRREEIRREARSTHLARCLLRGTELRRVEDPERTRTRPAWARIAELLKSHTGEDVRVIRQRVAEWSDGSFKAE